MLNRNVVCYGHEEPLAEQIPLRAGPLSLIYEHGDLRYIRLGSHEIVRRIYVAVRDSNWGTLPNRLSNVQMRIDADSFQIEYDVSSAAGAIDFAWRGAIRGDADGTIIFSMEGVAVSTFWRNRLGFCVLHPAECAGQRARVEHVDGTLQESVFPQAIAPQRVENGQIKPVAPFEEMAALAHEVESGVWAEVRFSGEIFEMEDQRNWTDASFKTYCTPLRLAFPVQVAAGTRIAQSITLTVRGAPARVESAPNTAAVFIANAGACRPLPRLGLGMASHGQPITDLEAQRLRTLNLHHLRVDLHAWQPDVVDKLRLAATQADELGVRLEVALFLSDAYEQELRALATAVAATQPPIWAWLIFRRQAAATPVAWLAAARQHLRGLIPAALFGSGTDAFFTELNRMRPPMELLDLVVYSINPQVHAFDNASMVETLPVQAETVKSARGFVGARWLAVSPVTLRMRSNPNAVASETPSTLDELPPQVDLRQLSLFGAGWTLGSLKYLGAGGVDSITYYETTGWRGVMERSTGSPLPHLFPSLSGAVFPLYHVLADVGEFVGGELVPGFASQPLAFEGMTLYKDGRMRVLLANLGQAPKTVLVQGLNSAVQVHTLDEHNALSAMRAPESFRQDAGETRQPEDGVLSVALPSFGLVRLDAGAPAGHGKKGMER